MKAGGSRCWVSSTFLNYFNAPQNLKWAWSTWACAVACQWAAKASASAPALPLQTCSAYLSFYLHVRAISMPHQHNEGRMGPAWHQL